MFVSERPSEFPFPAGSGLTWADYDLFRALGLLPFASAADLAALTGHDRSLVYRRLWKLSDRGYVCSDVLGASRERSARWRITPDGTLFLDPVDCIWHADWALARLLEVLPQVEWFYRVAGEHLGTLGKLVRFRWFRGISWDAAARYENGWVAFFWSGMMQGESRLRDLFARLGSDLVEYNLFGTTPMPSFLCFVVSDLWQRELVFRVARMYGLDSRLQVWCISDGSVSGVRDAVPSHGWVGQVLEGGGLGGWTLSSRLEKSLWAKEGGMAASRMLELVLEWPGLNVRFGQQAFREAGNSGRVGKILSFLRSEAFVSRYSSGGSYKYVLDSRGFDLLSRRDRINFRRRQANERNSVGPEQRGLKAHELGVMSVMGGFFDGGLHGASGWRSWEHLGSSGGIAPDGLVLLNSSPYGPGWHYVEYELRARGRSRVLQKLRGYASARRQDRWPLLVVVRNQRVEEIFQEIGREGKLRMLTSTVDRLGECSLLDDSRCWSMYGGLVALC